MGMTVCWRQFLLSLQRCHESVRVVHKERNVMSSIPKRERSAVTAELTGIWKSETKEEALLQLVAFKGKYQMR